MSARGSGRELDVDALRAAYDSVEDLTIGLEEELLLVDPRSFQLAPRASELLLALGDDARFKLELPAAQIEILTPPCGNVGEAIALLADARRTLEQRAGSVARALGAGVHPCAEREGDLNVGERYADIRRRYRAVAARQLVCALQVHVAVRGADRALAVYNALRSLLPEIAALAANAPYEQGRDTGLASVRPTIATMLPRQGIPPALGGWGELAAELAWGAASDTVPELRQWWWELRPHASYGTLEIRSPDAQIDSADSAAVAAFAHCLVAWLARRYDAGETLPCDASWRIAENRWSACRDGVQGTLADLDSGARQPTRERLQALIEELAPLARELDCVAELRLALALARRNGALRQRAFAAERGIAALPAWLAERFGETSERFNASCHRSR